MRDIPKAMARRVSGTNAENSLYEIKSRFGSKIITARKIAELMLSNLKTHEERTAEFERRVDEEIRRNN
jgi:hypothetical protein